MSTTPPPPSAPPPNGPNEYPTIVQYGLFGVAAISVLCALLHARYPEKFDEV